MLVSGEGNHPQKKESRTFLSPGSGQCLWFNVGLSSRWGEKKTRPWRRGTFCPWAITLALVWKAPGIKGKGEKTNSLKGHGCFLQCFMLELWQFVFTILFSGSLKQVQVYAVAAMWWFFSNAKLDQGSIHSRWIFSQTWHFLPTKKRVENHPPSIYIYIDR